MQRLVWCVCLLCMCGIARGQTDYEGVYWFDNNEDFAAEQYGNGTFDIDVSSLSNGLHAIHYMVSSANDVQSVPQTKLFMKIPQMQDSGSAICRCVIDGKPYHTEEVPAVGGIINWSFDVSGLAQGVHSIQVQVELPSGEITALQHGMFIRTATSEELASMKCYYLIDNSDSYVEAGTYDGSLFHFDLDVSALDNGLHQISYMLVGDNGVATKMCSALFTKIPVGGNGLTKYEYWLNDNGADKCVVEFKEHSIAYHLIELLPVESVPIRSSLFHFEVDKEHGPMVYAKNEFHIRFYDATGLFVDATREYVDPEVKEKVTEVSPLLQTQTLAKPGENEIRWYKFVAQVGDSVAFKTNKACSINVFAADGTEIYAASGSGSVNYGGSVIAEDGTYYVALHDVTATAGTDITLDFFHIGKYVVLEYSPEKVGVTPSVLCMELFGNGYQHLQKVELQKGSTLLTPDSIAVIERTKAQLLFVLENRDYERGAYTLRLYFADGEDSDVLTLEDAIAFEDPVWGDIEITFTDKRTLALPYPVSINVTNTGNVAYSMVPLGFAYDNVGSIQKVDFLNFGIGASEDMFKAGYSPTFVTDNLFGSGQAGAVATTLIPYLSPGETVSLTCGFSAGGHTRFTLSAWSGTPWSMMTDDALAALLNSGGDAGQFSTSCMPDPCDMLSLITTIPECACAIAMANIKLFANSYLAIGAKRNRYMNQYYAKDFAALGITSPYQEYNLESPEDIIRDLLEHCMEDASEAAFGRVAEAINLWRDLQEEFAEDDCPNRQNYPVEILTPGDPNDIIGFKSVAGSKFVSSDIEDTHYTIRFENDPKIATTSAHVITVRDTLDGRYLDLSTFSPTSVCIGDRMLELNGEKSFTKTLDMRTRINAIAEMSLDYDEAQGIAVWTIRSLDPMTMEETWDYMQGILPVNSNGEGEGAISFDIKLREGLADGTKISNRASIVFDNEAAIMTPTWINTIDDTKPVSEMVSIVEVNDTVIQLNWQGSDNATELWKYTLAVQVGENGVWSEILTDTLATSCMLRYYRDTDYGFCVLATDSAGNVESTEWMRKAEFMREYIAGDADKNGAVNLLDLNQTLSHILGNEVSGCDMLQMDANGDGSINVLDINAILQIILDADGEAATLRKRDNGVIRIINTKVL